MISKKEKLILNVVGHSVAPNSYMDTRYQIYFRVHAKSLKSSKLQSMVDLWMDWKGLNNVTTEED